MSVDEGVTKPLSSLRYMPLDASKNEIRLLKVHPNLVPDDTKIRGKLIHKPLSEDTFVALSYTWEDPALTSWPEASQCVLNLDSGEILHIGKNLTAFLLMLRGTTAVDLYWIDAICINQGDVDERNTEVTRMHDIYKLASEVLIWLGPEGEEGSLAASFIQKLHNQCYMADPEFDDAEYWPVWPATVKSWVKENILNRNHVESWRALNTLLCRPWWNRLWVTQELALAKRQFFVCGHEVIPFGGLFCVLWNISESYFPWISKLLASQGVNLIESRVDIVQDLLYLGSAAGYIDLLQALWFTIDRLATDDRDKIYGILGISSDSNSIISTADYSLDVSDLYKEVVKAMIATRGDLDYLSLVFNRGTDWSKPPWIPSASRGEIYMFNTSFFEGNIRTFDFHATNEKKPVVTFCADSPAFIAEGFLVDVVDGVGPAGYDFTSTAVQSRFENNSYLCNEETVLALWKTLVCSINEQGDDDTLLAPDVFGELFVSQCHIIESTPESNIDVPKAKFEAWYLQHRDWNFGGRPIRSWIQSAYRIAATKDAQIKDPLEHPRWNEFDKCWSWPAPGRRLMSTHQGYLGLVPDSTQPGDLVCLLFGGRMPFILRRIGGFYVLIGDSYVHGMMLGEAIKDLKRGLFHEQSFEIH
ncbi:hypothetical protein BP6252_12644 [Coleophoma cylindrospora]|uniref:Heterokaryon incompatibility domain-containing protein n=1 Tax=Coleophoma cylindrospora TaxID=1849047 RepID=A0A3D8QCW5_9HELO|nr:hypothetical protein BP6252_12644 [Coleophoma cylindrospora]